MITIQSFVNTSFITYDETGKIIKDIITTLKMIDCSYSDGINTGSKTLIYVLYLELDLTTEYRVAFSFNKEELKPEYNRFDFVEITGYDTNQGTYSKDTVYWKIEEAHDAIMKILAEYCQGENNREKNIKS